MISFPGKILLFGEYTIFHNGCSIALPSSHFTGNWDDSKKSDSKAVMAFIDHLNQTKLPFLKHISIDQVSAFHCNIPIGYGIGSSGSITAGVYQKFRNSTTTSLSDIQSQLGQMESYFHGQSSGFDPLISYIQKPIRLKDHHPEVVTQTLSINDLWLIDSGQSRSTKKMIQIFNEKMRDKDFKSWLEQDWAISVEKAIHHLLKHGEISDQFWMRISIGQLKNMTAFIPEMIQNIWQTGIENKQYSLKLCGAGGGGMFLAKGNRKVFVKDFPEVIIHDI